MTNDKKQLKLIRFMIGEINKLRFLLTNNKHPYAKYMDEDLHECYILFMGHHGHLKKTLGWRDDSWDETGEKLKDD